MIPRSVVKARDAVDRAVTLRSLPVILLEAEQLMRSAKAGAQDVARLLSRDPVLAGHVLKLANSAYVGLRQPVGNLSQAIVVLGFQTVRNLLLTVGVIESFRPNSPDAFDYPRFWAHSVATAIGTAEIARLCGCERSDEAYVAGLLHDIGKLIVAQHLPEQHARIRTRVSAGATEVEAERDVLGIDHGEVGARLVTSWQLPSIQIDAIRSHHDELGSRAAAVPAGLPDVLILANLLAIALGLHGGVPRLPGAPDGLSERLRYDEETLAEWIEELATSFEQAREFFSLAGLGGLAFHRSR